DPRGGANFSGTGRHDPICAKALNSRRLGGRLLTRARIQTSVLYKCHSLPGYEAAKVTGSTSRGPPWLRQLCLSLRVHRTPNDARATQSSQLARSASTSIK